MEVELKEELEDGEVESDEDDEQQAETKSNPEELAEDYELIQRPVSWTEALKKQGQDGNLQGSSRTLGIGAQYQSQPLRPHRPGPFAKNPMNAECDDEYFDSLLSDRSTSDSSDGSDDDCPTGKKSKRMGDAGHFKPLPQGALSSIAPGWSSWNSAANNKPPQDAGMSDGQDFSSFNNQAAMFQQKRKPNNIWSKVLQEEEVSDIFGKVNVQEITGRDLLIDRGPETFSIKYEARPSVRHRSDSSSVSSGGLSDNELEFLRGGKRMAVQNSSVVDEETGELLVEQFGQRPRKRKILSKQVSHRVKQKKQMIRKLKRMNPRMLSQYIAGKLSEPKVHLLTNAITLLGRDAVIALFLKTMKIERRGGLLIMNQQRRRTAGGVFFYLLRGDKRYPMDVVDEIFQTERQVQRKNAKRDFSRKRLLRKARLEKKKAKEEQMKLETMSEEPIQVNQDVMEEGGVSDADSEQGPDESDLDSDEFYGIEGAVDDNNAAGPSRKLVEYQDEDCIDIHCDASDLI